MKRNNEMELYVTSKNSGPTWSGPDPKYVEYIGTSLEEAVGAIPNVFQRQGTDITGRTAEPEVWSALPRGMRQEMIQFYMADGWWYSIVKIEM
jgi:hypothetical protein